MTLSHISYEQVMTYNVYGKPLFSGQCGQRERLCRIPRWIDDNVPDVEVIGFQVWITFPHKGRIINDLGGGPRAENSC